MKLATDIRTTNPAFGHLACNVTRTKRIDAPWPVFEIRVSAF